MKLLLIFSFFTNLFCTPPQKVDYARLEAKAAEAKAYCEECDMNTKVCILVDYSVHSGSDRLFVWSFERNCVLDEYPAAHGRGRSSQNRSDRPRFSNTPDTYLSSLGKCKIAERYVGKYGISYRLDGLERSNSKVRERDIVIHAFDQMPDTEIFPEYSPRSRGCLMLSEANMERLDQYLQDEENVLLYIYK